MDTTQETQEPEITLVELDNILAGELDQKWSALSDSMKQFVFEQVKGKENFSAAYYAAKDLVEGAHANALNLDIGCRLDLSVFLTQSLVACADPDDQKLYKRAREIADECGLPALRWLRIGYAVAMLHSAVKLYGIYAKRSGNPPFQIAVPYIRFALDGLKAELGKSVYDGEGKWFFAGFVGDLFYQKAA